MPDFFYEDDMNIADIIVIVVVIAALALALRYLRRHPSGNGCDGSCASCGRKGGCPSSGGGDDRQ